MDDFDRLSALGDDPDAWDALGDRELEQVVSAKVMEYGASQDGSRIPGLFALYRHAMERLDVPVRRGMLTGFCDMVERQKGLGHMGLMMFLVKNGSPPANPCPFPLSPSRPPGFPGT